MPNWKPISLKTREVKGLGPFLPRSTTKQVQEDHTSRVNHQVKPAKGAQESIPTMKVSCINITLRPVVQPAYIPGPREQLQKTLCLNNPQSKTLWCSTQSSWTKMCTRLCKGCIRTGFISENWLRWNANWIWKRAKEYQLIIHKWQSEEEWTATESSPSHTSKKEKMKN